MVRIEPINADRRIDWREVWQKRELLLLFIWRDLTLRYRQTLIGAAWAILQPFTAMVVFSIFFGLIAGVPSDGIPYPIFSFVALVPWTYFANALGQSADSLVLNSTLLKRVYFPRAITPTAYIVGGLVDFGLAFVILIGMMLVYKMVPSITALILIPSMLLLLIITALGIGLGLSAINVTYRDVRHIVPFLIQIWMFATPVAYSTSKVDPVLQPLFGLNPMASVVEGFRVALLGKGNLSAPMLLISVCVSLIIFLVGQTLFHRLEKGFADVL